MSVGLSVCEAELALRRWTERAREREVGSKGEERGSGGEAKREGEGFQEGHGDGDGDVMDGMGFWEGRRKSGMSR